MSLLAYADDGLVHETSDGRKTLCGQKVTDVPMFPRVISPLSCPQCDQKRKRGPWDDD